MRVSIFIFIYLISIQSQARIDVIASKSGRDTNIYIYLNEDINSS